MHERLSSNESSSWEDWFGSDWFHGSIFFVQSIRLGFANFETTHRQTCSDFITPQSQTCTSRGSFCMGASDLEHRHHRFSYCFVFFFFLPFTINKKQAHFVEHGHVTELERALVVGPDRPTSDQALYIRPNKWVVRRQCRADDRRENPTTHPPPTQKIPQSPRMKGHFSFLFVVLALCALARAEDKKEEAVDAKDEAKVKTYQRIIPADVLRGTWC